MRRPLTTLSVALASALLAASCATVKTTSSSDPAVDFSRYRTFRIAGDRMETADIHRLQDLVTEKLRAKGLRTAPADQADLNVVVRLIRGPGDVAAPMEYGWWVGNYATGAATDTPMGTLVVDLVDRSRNQLVWRGQAQGTIPSVGAIREEKVRIAIDRLLSDYPPKRKTA